MSKKIYVIIILVIILGLGTYFAYEKRGSSVSLKDNSTTQLTQEELNKNLGKLLKKHSPESILAELSSLPFKDGEKNKEFVKLFGQIHSMAT